MSVRKDKRKNGFRYVLDYYDQFGKRHYQALPKGTTRKEADAAERGGKKSVRFFRCNAQ